MFEMLFAALFAALGTFFACFGLQHILACVRMFRAGQSAEGTITAMKPALRSRKGRTWISYIAVITFETVWHEKREVDHADAFGAVVFKTGDRVKVWYDRDDPSVFTLSGRHFIKDMASVFLFSLAFGFPGWSLLIHLIKTP